MATIAVVACWRPGDRISVRCRICQAECVAIRIAIDTLGGDSPPQDLIRGALDAVADAALPQAPTLIFFGDQRAIEPRIRDSGHAVVHAPRCLAADDPLRVALRGDKSSSMRAAIAAVAGGDADAVVSPGSTGALVALSRHLIGLLPDLRRAAIIKRLAAENDHGFRMLDLGANIRADAGQLHQYARMGTAAAHAGGVSRPKVALLNIGAELSKGPQVVRDAGQLIGKDRCIHYAGFMEPDRMFASDMDVVVVDGFAGNIALKTAEGAARLARHLLRGELARAASQTNGTELVGRLERLQDAYNPQRYNGALLLGLRQVVVKSHGGADRQGFAAAVGEAMQAVAGALVAQVAAQTWQT